MYDLIIIGAGPAGLTAGIYARRANLKTLILEKETIGGQISSSPLVENYPGFEKVSGTELANHFFNQAIELGAQFEIEIVLSIEGGPIKKVVTDCGEYQTKSIIIATGAKHRTLGLDNEAELIGKGVHFCATCDGAFYKDKVVAVIGGANSAAQNALYLASICKKVYLIARSNNLKCEKKLVEDLEKTKNIEIINNANLTELHGEELDKITIDIDGKKKDIEVAGVFMSIGALPNSDLMKGKLELNQYGYYVSRECQTNEEGIFVAGDVREKNVRQVTTAVNDGTIAALLAIDYVNK